MNKRTSKYLVITIDVEPDCSYNWTYSNPLKFEGVSVGIKEILHPMFKKYGIKPTYLINNVVLEDNKSVEILKNLDGEYELGAHLHPEFIEPQKKYYDYAGKKGEANLCFYPYEIQQEKIVNYKKLFYVKFGFNPVSFRAGRFSANNKTFEILNNEGFKIDTSATPTVRWEDKTRESIVEFPTINQPYWIGNLLEVPVTIIKKRNPKRLYLTKKSYWLRPFYSSTKEMIIIVKTLSNHSNIVIYNIMFHNVEVLPGLSPYVLNDEDQMNYLNTLKEFFEYCKSHDIIFITLKELFDIYAK